MWKILILIFFIFINFVLLLFEERNFADTKKCFLLFFIFFIFTLKKIVFIHMTFKFASMERNDILKEKNFIRKMSNDSRTIMQRIKSDNNNKED